MISSNVWSGEVSEKNCKLYSKEVWWL